ncbi:MAG: ribosome biogenesis/translation initiation ATPase RLI [Candidatus Lokiarchaeota archaeon]|nr:ribosome biogenesis/translation initiation ATPase RLI [Candidatus Lokiarchaeota archaeon]
MVKKLKKVYLIDYSKCTYDSCGRPCIENCPVTLTNKKMAGKVAKSKLKPAIDFKKSSSQIIIHSETCIKCGICIHQCPKNAIYVKNLMEEDETQQKVHQYTENGFRLYNLPTLVTGRVTGLCGPNGIGKSTILQILALNLKPNFGEYTSDDEDMTWGTIAQKFRDNNVRDHFLEVKKGMRSISYKKQVLDILYEKYKNQTVEQILEGNTNANVDFKKRVYDALDIYSIRDRILKQCSGGELQRFAISLKLLQNADVFLIDEPVTFLDIKKRIRLAELLGVRASGINQKDPKCVLVVDHDLAILDYMSDVIHLFYGEPHQFGTITGVQPVRAGINSYLNGYLRSENLQFRETKIKFRKTISGRTWSNAQILAEWGYMEKQFDEFKLQINPGLLYQNEILGVVGENGLGKTTFFKILVGSLTPDKGSVDLTEEFAISYKPQYITGNYNGTVEQLITEYSQKYVQDENLLLRLYTPLGVDKLFDTQVSELSGGQLQRTFIATCLSKDANLYLIDEPSAYLDVEERLQIAEIIRSHAKSTNASAICIEHDMQITDALADRMLIFLGKPSENGYTEGPLTKRDGMNTFLKSLDITFRRDDDTGRARINKKGSHLDQIQRANEEYYGYF